MLTDWFKVRRTLRPSIETRHRHRQKVCRQRKRKLKRQRSLGPLSRREWRYWGSKSQQYIGRNYTKRDAWRYLRDGQTGNSAYNQNSFIGENEWKGNYVGPWHFQSSNVIEEQPRLKNGKEARQVWGAQVEVATQNQKTVARKVHRCL